MVDLHLTQNHFLLLVLIYEAKNEITLHLCVIFILIFY